MSEMPTAEDLLDVVVLTGASDVAWLRRNELLPCADAPTMADRGRSLAPFGPLVTYQVNGLFTLILSVASDGLPHGEDFGMQTPFGTFTRIQGA